MKFRSEKPGRRLRTAAWIAAAMLAPAGIGAAQTPAQTAAAKTAAKKESAGETKKKVPIADLTRVNTQETARQAAQDAANKKQPKKAETPEAQTSSVTEFHTVSPDSTAGGAAVESGKSKGGLLKDVHGEVYGAAGAPGHAEGGSVGATTRNGKTSIYVETQHASTNTPPR